ncbi:hypothetical protein JG687_00017791, partial [Phytophthora cactorum]
MERVFALETHTRSTSISRVLVVCLGTPIPMITLVVLQELIPLQDPSEDWHVNEGFWIRTVILAEHTIIGQARFMIDGVVLSAMRLVLLSACAAAMFTFRSTMAPVFYLLLIIAVRFVVGNHILHEMIAHSDQLIRYIIFVCAQVTLGFVYPSYESLFRAEEGTRYQMLMILLLPMIKVAVKNMLL